MITLKNKHSRFILIISMIVFSGIVWHYGEYGSSGEYIIAMLLLLIYLDKTLTQSDIKTRVKE